MRAPLFLSIIGCSVTLLGCASQPHRTTIHYSPPSVAPTRQWVSNAQSHAAKAKSSVEAAVSAADLQATRLPLQTAQTEIDALSNELLNAQTALTDLEKKTGGQTDALNRAIDDKNAALDQNAVIERKLKAIVHQRNKLFLLLVAALAWIFRGPLLWLIKFLFGVISKLPIGI